MAVMNMAIHGIESDLGDGPANTFFNDKHARERVDFYLANPPFNQKVGEAQSWKMIRAGTMAFLPTVTPTLPGCST